MRGSRRGRGRGLKNSRVSARGLFLGLDYGVDFRVFHQAALRVSLDQCRRVAGCRESDHLDQRCAINGFEKFSAQTLVQRLAPRRFDARLEFHHQLHAVPISRAWHDRFRRSNVECHPAEPNRQQGRAPMNPTDFPLTTVSTQAHESSRRPRGMKSIPASQRRFRGSKDPVGPGRIFTATKPTLTGGPFCIQTHHSSRLCTITGQRAGKQIPGRVGVPPAGFGVSPKRSSEIPVSAGRRESSSTPDASNGWRNAHPTRKTRPSRPGHMICGSMESQPRRNHTLGLRRRFRGRRIGRRLISNNLRSW